MEVNFGKAKALILGVIVLIIIGVVVSASVQIVDSGNRGVLLHWNAVDIGSLPLEEGLHFVIPFQDSVVNMEVRTLKFDLHQIQSIPYTKKWGYNMKAELSNQQ
jgi:regulator of protease activity HflC (stomatin/prohibitin superfamily)